jgi:hypothetical protein
MSRILSERSGMIVSLAVVWAVTAHGAAKPRDPNAARITKSPPPKGVSARTLKPVANVQPPRVPLENPATFTRDMPFGRAIEILRHCTNPGAPITVLWRDVEGKAGITSETPIGLDGVPGLSIRQYLELLLRSVSAGSSAELSFCIDGGVVLVATKDSLPKPKLVTRVYDISDLAAPPSMAGSMPMMMPMQMMSPFGGGNSMMPYGNYGTGMTPYGNSYPGLSYNPGTSYSPVGYPQGNTVRAPAGSLAGS